MIISLFNAMKNYLFFLWISFVLIFGSIACSDDDGNGEVNGPELDGIVKTVKLVDNSEGDGLVSTYEFFYDSEMRLTKIYNEYTHKNGDLCQDTLYFSYETNKVTVIKGWILHHVVATPDEILDQWSENIRDTIVYILKNGRAQYCQIKGTSVMGFDYDETAGNLVMAKNEYYRTYFEWKEENIFLKKDVSIYVNEDDNYINEILYLPMTALNNTNIDLNPLFSSLISGCSDEVIFGVWAGILGNRCKNLIEDKEDYEDLKYEMQGKYVTKIIGESGYAEIKYMK